MFRRTTFLALVPVTLSAAAPAAAPEKALKYHEALLKRPHNAALFDRFFGAWIDEQPVETLGTFLSARAEANGGQDWTILALYQLRRGQEDAALTSLGKAIAALPDDPALAMDRARLRLRRMEFEPARKDLAIVMAGKDEPLALEAAKLTGKSWLRESRTDEAIKTWDAVLAAHPGDEDLLEDLVETAAADGEAAQALIYSDKLIAATKDPYQKTLRSLRRGDLLAQSGKRDEAVAAYAATLDQVGEGSWLEREVLAQIDKAYRKQDRLDDLKTELEKLATANPRRLLIHRQLAKLEASQGQADAAIGRFREVLKRSPGDRELHEEFVRLLTDSERYEDASSELEKLIALAPAESGLYLQLATLRSRENKPEAVLAALQKAHELLGKDESASIRIAGLMLQYGQTEPGEALLKKLAEAPGASPAAGEALAAQYGRTNRKPEALELLKKLGASDDADAVIRAASSISALGESPVAFTLLASRADKFGAEPRFLAALAQSALAAGKAAEAVTQAVKLVRLAKQTTELAESVNLATRVISGADKVAEWRKTLETQATRTTGETCLLANLADLQDDSQAVTTLLAPATDPLLVHFHAALLDKRGEFAEAIAALTRLADTDEGRKAAYFKDLAELQQRAGKTGDAIATVERWKQSAPGDKAAWILASRLLRESGKPEEAVKTTRLAVARFEGDTDLAASLAQLHDEAGQWTEAEAIYWRLYDEAQTPADQTRWAAPLAQLALKTGRTEEIGDMLRERAKGNRRSIGPLLAQAELARVTQHEDKRRDFLLEAVRIQPKDLDLRLQIATLEEKSGNPDRVVAVLEEALPYDAANRIRSALAQAYLRQGQTLKGLREMRAMSGKGAGDARAIELSAATLAGAKMYDEAIQYLRDGLPSGGDWRSRYLLAIMLEQDGRETEAVPIFLDLLQAQGDLVPPILPANPNQPAMRNRYNGYTGSKEALGFIRMMSSKQAAYAHLPESRNRYYFSGMGNGGMTGPFRLPDEAEDARQFALVHLIKLAKKDGAPLADAPLAARLHAAGIADPDFTAALLDALAEGNGSNSGFTKLFEKYPNQPGLFEFVIAYGQPLSIEATRKALADTGNLPTASRLNALARIIREAKPEDPAWDDFIATAQASANDKDEKIRMGVGYQLMSLLNGTRQDPFSSTPSAEIPPARREAIKKILLQAMATGLDDKEETRLLHLAAVSLGGTTDQWIAALNAAVKENRKASPSAKTLVRASFGRFGSYASSGYGRERNPFELPKLQNLPLRSLSEGILGQFKVDTPDDESNWYSPYEGRVSIAEAAKHLDAFESPALRAWIAMRAGNPAVAAKILTTEPPAAEAVDFTILRAMQALAGKQHASAFELLQKARADGGSDREFSTWAAVSLLAVAAEMPKEETAGLASILEPLLIQCRQTLGVPSAGAVADQAQRLGLADLAKRLQPVGPMAGATRGANGPATLAPTPAASSSSSSSSNGSLVQMNKFISEKKYEAAAREARQLLQAARASSWNSSSEADQITRKLGPEGTDALMKLVDPGESKSLVKRLEYADMAITLGKKDAARKALEQLHTERPDDSAIAAKLAFVLPMEMRAERHSLMTQASASDDFSALANWRMRSLSENGHTDPATMLDFFDDLATWLETAPPISQKANLTWIPYHAKAFFENSSTQGFANLMLEAKEAKAAVQPDEKDKEAAKIAEAAARQKSIARRLALAMLRQPLIAEEGFRLLSAAKAWPALPPEEMDAHARQALAAAISLPEDRNYGSNRFFMLRLGNGGSWSGNGLEPFSSVNWISARLAKAKNPAEILPAAYLEDLRRRDPKSGDMVAALGDLKTVDQLRKLWEKYFTNATPGTSNTDAVALMLHQAVMTRAAALPGTSAFFVECLGKLKFNPSRSSGSIENSLFQASIIAAAGASRDEEAETICRAIAKALFGEKIDWDKPADPRRFYSSVSYMSNLMQGQRGGIEPAAMVRLVRTFYRLRVPLGENEYGVSQSFQRKSLTTAEEAESFFASLGWLCEAKDWTPFAAWIVTSNRSSSGAMTFSATPKLLTDSVMQYMSINFSSTEFNKRLAERKTGRFGALLLAAARSSQPERGKLTAQAFAEAGPALAKMPAARLDDFALVAEWLPDDARAKLPPALRERFKSSEDKRRDDLVKAADAFLADKDPNSTGNVYGLGLPDGLFEKLAAVDPPKAMEIFLEGERRFTDSIAKGGQFSTTGSGGFQILFRDYSLQNMLTDYSNSPFYENPVAGLKFLIKLQATPEGGRFSYSPFSPSEKAGSLSRVGTSLLTAVSKQKPSGARTELTQMFGYVNTLDPSLRMDALMAMACSKSARSGSASGNRAEILRKEAEASRAAFKDDFRFCQVICGLPWWKNDSQEGHGLTLAALASILKDPAIRENARQELAFSAVAAAPDVLDDPGVGATVAALYESYAGAGRSAVNASIAILITALAKQVTGNGDQSVVRRVHDAFWKNALASKPGGHTPIPPEMAGDLITVSSKAGDATTIKRLINQTQGTMIGDVALLGTLVSAGQYDLARSLLPPGGVLYSASAKGGEFNPGLAEHLKPFLATVSDPEQALRFEAQMLLFKERAGSPSGETTADRALGLAAAYKAAPPKDRSVRLEVLRLITRASQPAAIELRTELDAWVKDCDYKDSIARWDSAWDSKVGTTPRWLYSTMEGDLVQAAAMADLLAGDTALLERATDAIVTSPVLPQDPQHGYYEHGGTPYVVATCHQEFVNRAAFWIWLAIARGQTSGFEKALPSFEALALATDGRFEFQEQAVNSPLAICQFLSHWIGQPQRFEALCAKMTKRQETAKRFPRHDGLAPMATAAARFAGWKSPSAKEMRDKAMLAIFANPAFAPLVSRDGGWYERLAASIPGAEVDSIATMPLEAVIPDVWPGLAEARGKRMAAEKNYPEAEASFQKSIAACPPAKEWNDIRSASQVALAEVLVAAGKKAEARTLIASMPGDGIGSWISGRYRTIAAALGVKSALSSGPREPAPSHDESDRDEEDMTDSGEDE